MTLRVAYTYETDITKATAALKTQLKPERAKWVLYFAASRFDPQHTAAAMSKAFDGATVVGCTTAGELTSGKMLKHSIVAMLLDDDELELVAAEVATPIKDGVESVRQALGRLGQQLGKPISKLGNTDYVGLVLTDGMSGAEEEVMATLTQHCSIPFVGGSAGDDLKFQQTFVSLNGTAHSNATLLVILKPKHGFEILKTQSFKAQTQTLVATDVDEPNRTVRAFNGKPAAAEYARVLGIAQEALASAFMQHPLGLMVDEEPFVRSPQQLKGDAVVFYCAVKKGMELRLLDGTDIVADTSQALAETQARGPIRGLINFHCILRTLGLEANRQTDAYGKLFSAIPTIGFSTYGEAYIGHINQTSTMLVLR